MKRLNILGALMLLPLLACAGTDGDAAPEAAEATTEIAINVRVLEVAAEDLAETITIAGTVRAVRATDISTEEDGVVATILADRGALVRGGQAVIRLDRDLLDAQRKSANAAAVLARYNEERMRTLVEANSVSKQELLVAATELEQAEQAVNVAELRYQRAAIKSPFEGVVAERYVELGQLVGAGTPVARVIDPFTMKLEGWVTEREVGWLREGNPALVSVEGIPTALAGMVHWIGLEAHPGNGKFPVELRVENPDLTLRVGVVARARVLKQTHEGVVAVPRDAVVQSRSGPAVYVVESDRAVLHPVRLGADEGLMVVVDHGLAAGETLVVRGQRDLSPGVLVAVQERSDRRDGTIDGDPLEVRADLPAPPVERVPRTGLEGSR